MKKSIRTAGSLFLLLILPFFFSCREGNSGTKENYGPATRELVQLVEQQPELKSLLVASIEKASKINGDRNSNPVQNFGEYYDFVSYCETAMPWTLQKKPAYREIFDNIFQSLACFYFLIDQPLPQLEGKGYFNNSVEYSEPFASWLVTFNKSWGNFLDTEASWNEEYYRMVRADSAFGLQNGWYENPSNWKTFNEFFARRLRNPEQRPIASPGDNSVVASFADSKPQGAWAIDADSNILAEEGVPVKSATIRSVRQLLGEDSEYRDAFAGGTFMHSFLNVNDYHRYHFPISGTIMEARIIQGSNPTGGTLSWDNKNKRYAFDPSSIGWQTLETRGCVILDTGEYGLVALLPIGMAAVGSVNFEENVKVGTQAQKGDMLGYFLFGGSDFILLFQEGVTFTLDVSEEGNGAYQHLLMGEKLGLLVKK